MKYLKILLPLLLLAVIALIIFLAPRFVRINSISCKSQFGPCTSLESKLTLLTGKKLYDVKKEVRTVLGAEDSISDFSIRFKVPDKFEVLVIEKKPKFALKDLNSDVFALVDKEGFVLSIVSQSTLPQVLISDRAPNVGEEISQEYFFALNIIYNIFASYQARQGIIENNSLLVNLPQGVKVIFPLSGDKDVLLGALRLIMERLNESNKDSRINEVAVRQIDLRFKNPVLK
ncbi:MAG: hypothetical protein AAB875_01570 [Patescibacteria group bacterium]